MRPALCIFRIDKLTINISTRQVLKKMQDSQKYIFRRPSSRVFNALSLSANIGHQDHHGRHLQLVNAFIKGENYNESADICSCRRVNQ